MAAVRYATRLGRVGLAAPVLTAAAVAVLPLVSLAQHWDDNDQSANTSINDNAVFATLPQDSTLLGQGGVFGYDMFYFRYVYNVRPDVSMPSLPDTDGAALQDAGDGLVYTTTGAGGGGGGFGRGPGGFGGAGNFVSADDWSVPVVIAPGPEGEGVFGGGRLTLYRVDSEPPDLFTSDAPANEVNQEFGDVTLVGYDIETRDVQAGGAVHLRLYWDGDVADTFTVTTREGDSPYTESHQLGFGLVARYVQEAGEPADGELLVEEYDLVVLSSVGSGDQPLWIQLTAGADTSEWIELTALNVEK
jgi:hypothetical protein